MTYDPFDPFNEVSMYQDFFLRVADQAEADSVLFDEQTNVQGDIVETFKIPRYAAVDVIGVFLSSTDVGSGHDRPAARCRPRTSKELIA